MNDDGGGTGGTDGTDESAVEQVMPPRLRLLQGLHDTPRRVELRRLAAVGRDVIEHLVSTSASIDQLAEAADRLQEVAALLASMPRGKAYEGFSEAANAGHLGEHGEELAVDDPERYAFFDHSPFIGLANPLSPPIVFRHEPGRVVGTVTFGAAYEGPPGCVHGGYVAAAFDELLGAAQSMSGTQGMTARLVVDYRSPTPLGQPLVLEGEMTSHEGRKIFCAGRLHAGDRLCAEAEGLFISFDPDRFHSLLTAREARLKP